MVYNLITDIYYNALCEDSQEQLAHLQRADAHLNKLRLYLWLAHQWGWLTAGQYRHVSAMVAEVGRLLGGWVRLSRGRLIGMLAASPAPGHQALARGPLSRA